MAFLVDKARNAVAANFGGLAHGLSTHPFSLDETPNQAGKVAVVTGGSQGIGYGVSHTLLTHNIDKLFILSMSADVVRDAKDAIAQEMGQEKADKTVWLQCDLADWKRVKDVAEHIKGATDRLDILVNNAGRGTMTYQLTDYGVDRHMAVNHMGHVVLTSHLLPLMKKTADKGSVVRIVNLSSNLHESVPSDLQFKSLQDLNRDLGAKYLYGRTKLAAILYARYFDRHVSKKGHSNIIMNATHPGIVSTKQSTQDIHEPYPLAGYGVSVGLEPFKKSQFEGAVSTIFAATTTTEGGQYICPPALPDPGSKLSQDEGLADDLMALTREVVREKTKADSVDKGCPMDDLAVV
ncbi:putative oxidoreductase bli-4, mitochondrial [Claviceps africana]|uniref:Oxidoreductase bli-4, mitochondrial n=1 Tax=Claviceps africana TaxID=83212 RepID=A0A8K0JB30_9HYPO|nr:putative oxidoreductase bli-4, mitochondrial [Claviceps africana]